MIGSFPLPRIESWCHVTVAIPARNEEALIGKAIEAFAEQDGTREFELLVFANNCTDSTAQQARLAARAHPWLRVHVVDGKLPAGSAHVGGARKYLMDAAASRLIAAGRPAGIVATTDADTIVAPDWIVNIREELKRADAVAGHVEIAPGDQLAMLPSVRLLYARETELRQRLIDLEDIIDPRPEDAPPRHGAFVGASFAVTAECYVRAGGIPIVPCLEDREFMFALRRIDARIRHSLRVRAFTSSRRDARVFGGFGTFINHLHKAGATGETFFVQDPRPHVRQLMRRALFRCLWRGERAHAELMAICGLLEIDLALPRTPIDRSLPFGLAYERATALADRSAPNQPMISVDRAIELCRVAAASLKALYPNVNRSAISNAVEPFDASALGRLAGS